MNQTKLRTPRHTRLLAYLVVFLIFFGGALIAMYPVLSTFLNNMEHARVARDFSSNLDEIPREQQNESLAAAQAYNSRLGSLPIYDAWNGPDNPVSPEYLDYLSHLADTEVMGQLTIPSIQSNLPIYHGTAGDTLEKGLGHLYGTSLPVGGASTHSALTGHTGMVNATLFDNLIDVVEGDAIYVRTAGQDIKYEVSNIQVVLPHETEALQVVEGEDLLTLITCTPYGVNTHRLLVTGHRVPMDPEEARIFDNAIRVLEPWMILVGSLVLLALLAVLVRVFRKRK